MGSLAPELSYGAGSLTAVLLTAGEQFALGAVGDLTGQAVARMLGGRLSFSDLDYGSAVGVGIATMLGSPEGADALLPFGLEGTALQSFGSILGTIAGRITVSGLSPAVGLSAPPSAPGGLGGGPGGPTGAGPAPGGSEGSDASISGGANGNGAVGDGDPASDAYLEEIQGGTNSINVGSCVVTAVSTRHDVGACRAATCFCASLAGELIVSEGTIVIISGAIVVSALIALRWVPTAPVPERNTGAGRSTAPRLPSSARPDQLTIFLALFVVIGFTFTPLIFLFDVALLTVAALQPLLNVASTSMSLSPRGANFLDGAVSLVVLVLWWASIRFTGRGRFLTTEIVHRIPGERTSRKHVVIAAILLAIGYASFKATMWFLAPMSPPF